jgi:Icc-related predicted phosphoesterase
MKIINIADTHGLHKDLVIDEADMIIFAGDFMTDGYNESEVDDFIEWFSNIDIKYKIMIAGNHDRFVQNFKDDFTNKLPKSIIYLEDSSVEIEGLKIYGTPWSKVFGGWAFNASENALQALFDGIPEDIDILISHAPQYKMLDNISGRNVGEKTLSSKIQKLNNLSLHVFGHIHDEFGMKKPLCEHYKNNYEEFNAYFSNDFNNDHNLLTRYRESKYRGSNLLRRMGFRV